MKRLVVALAVIAPLWSAACSGGGPVNPPPPVGKYGNSSLNGQYAFVTSGEVFTPNSFTATPLSRTGSFTADGQGHITTGVEDVNANGSVTNAVAITGGSYTVNADGRGFMTLVLGQNSITLGFTLTSTSDGLLIDETSTQSQASTGSGNFIKQNSASFAVSSVAGPYVFDFSGLDGNQQGFCPCPESLVGQFSASSGVIGPGFFDDNDDDTLSNSSFTGTLSSDPLNPQEPITNSGRGIALIAGQNFVFYIVDSNRVRFISTNLGMLAGDAVAQDSTVPTNVSSLNSGFAFIVAGASGSGGVTRVGRFTATGSSVNNVLMDTNNAGVFTQTNSATSPSISLDPAVPGRGILTFKDPNLSVPFSFVFYLSSAGSGVIQETSESSPNVAVDVADGSITAQSDSPFTATKVTGNYAFNWSGLSVQNGGSFAVQDEEDIVGQANISNLTLTGAADQFQFQNGFPQVDNIVGGAIAIGGDGTGATGMRNTMSIKLTKGSSATINFVVYVVNPQLAFFANKDNAGTSRIVAGVLKAQQ